MAKVFLWVNSDLDGVGSTIVLGNIFPDIEYKSVFFGDFYNQYKDWVDDNIDNYEKVFVVGMVLDQSLVNKIDDPKVVFVSDRGEKIQLYESTCFCDDDTSCTRLLYKKFRHKFEFPVELKKLILYIDDYNSYNLAHKESEYLNGLYRSTRFNRFSYFVKRFWNGYDGLTDKEIALADSFFEAAEKEYSTLDKFEGQFKTWRVLATFTKMAVNEIAKKLIDNHDHDAIVIVNPDTQFVSFRKNPNSDADIVLMAENLCGGGGSEWASGGKISQKFLDFTTKLIQI